MIFRKVLIANRGEIAVRIQKTLRKMDIASIALYTREEADDLHVRLADQAVCLGSGTLEETWLNIPLIIQIALEHGADAIHPGYGFLSENASFARAAEQAQIAFIGPPSQVIEVMGSKTRAAEIAQKAHIPLLPRLEGLPSQLIRQGASLGFPLLVKAAAGGGGKGMIRIDSARELEKAVHTASQQAQRYFGDDRVYLEKLVQEPRHVEVQILADHHGNYLHLMERECTLQRNHQKVVEEAPSVSLNHNSRKALHEHAIRLARSVGYQNAGTIEFLLDEKGQFYFLEMNTRIQVEHPVTEMITGVDIVQQQIRIARGQPLNISQDQIKASGHAIECRLYAEDPAQNFKPSAGNIHQAIIPAYPGVRIDSSIQERGKVHAQFDAMIAKVVSHAADRNQAIAKMDKVLTHTFIHGVTTNQALLSAIMKSQAFAQNQISTQSILNHLKTWAQKPEDKNFHTVAAALHIWLQRYKDTSHAWRLAAKDQVQVNNEILEVFYHPMGNHSLHLNHQNKMHQVTKIRVMGNKISCAWNKTPHTFVFNNLEGKTMLAREGFHYHVLFKPIVPAPRIDHQGKLQKALELKASLFGRVLRIHVSEKQKVKPGDTLLVLESMKMENTLLASDDQVISHINVKEGDQVSDGQILLRFES